MLRRLFNNRVDVDREWLHQHRTSQFPLYKYIDVKKSGSLVDEHDKLSKMDETEREKRKEFKKKCDDLMPRPQERPTASEVASKSDPRSNVKTPEERRAHVKAFMKFVQDETDRRAQLRDEQTQLDDILCEKFRNELQPCVYDDGGEHNVTKVEFRRWRKQWMDKKLVSDGD